MSHNSAELLNELSSKYGEWLEMAGEGSPVLMNQILANILLRERSEKEFYKKIVIGRQKQTLKI